MNVPSYDLNSCIKFGLRLTLFEIKFRKSMYPNITHNKNSFLRGLGFEVSLMKILLQRSM